MFMFFYVWSLIVCVFGGVYGFFFINKGRTYAYELRKLRIPSHEAIS